jgi:hypothetical protein
MVMEGVSLSSILVKLAMTKRDVSVMLKDLIVWRIEGVFQFQDQRSRWWWHGILDVVVSCPAFLGNSGAASVPTPNWLMHPTLTHSPIRGNSAACTNPICFGPTPHQRCKRIYGRDQPRRAKKLSTSRRVAYHASAARICTCQRARVHVKVTSRVTIHRAGAVGSVLMPMAGHAGLKTWVAEGNKRGGESVSPLFVETVE